MVAEPDDLITINLSDDTMVDDERIVDSIIAFDRTSAQHVFQLRSKYICGNKPDHRKPHDKVYICSTEVFDIEINQN
jgi:hypothetical protein